MTDLVQCVIDYCTNPPKHRGWCVKHYKSWHNNGHPLYTDADISFTIYDDTTKQCSTCHQILPKAEFGTYKRQGKTKINAGCKKCSYTRQEKWRKEGSGKTPKPNKYKQDLKDAAEDSFAFRKQFPLSTVVYPTSEDLLRMAKQFRYFSELAREFDIKIESLKYFLAPRPELKEAIQKEFDKNAPDPEEVHRASRKRWVENNPEKVKEIRRRWARNQAPEKRARWNHYNRERRMKDGALLQSSEDLAYSSTLLLDPCSYCLSSQSGTIDHIVPIAIGGNSRWDNLTASCKSCNSSKNDTPLLLFLLRRCREVDREKSRLDTIDVT